MSSNWEEDGCRWPQQCASQYRGPVSGRVLHRSGGRWISSPWNSVGTAGQPSSASSLCPAGYRQLALTPGAANATVSFPLVSCIVLALKAIRIHRVKSTHCCNSRSVCTLLSYWNCHTNGAQQQVLHPACWPFENSSEWFSAMLEEFVSLSHAQFWGYQRGISQQPSQEQPQGWVPKLATGCLPIAPRS